MRILSLLLTIVVLVCITYGIGAIVCKELFTSVDFYSWHTAGRYAAFCSAGAAFFAVVVIVSFEVGMFLKRISK